ncbi:uncharacterized protein LOC134772302 [Penaeus indicus]|uniref:uncharacterized protein LOC134772302 n=1 Tax=Penaeus indicus TaxID=29960 RepID=UPI00300C30A9
MFPDKVEIQLHQINFFPSAFIEAELGPAWDIPLEYEPPCRLAIVVKFSVQGNSAPACDSNSRTQITVSLSTVYFITIGIARSSVPAPVHVLQLTSRRPKVARGNSLGEMANENHSGGMKKWFYLAITLVALSLPYYWHLGVAFSKGVNWVVGGGAAEAAKAKTTAAAAAAAALGLDQRRRLAAELREVQSEVARLAGTKAVVDSKWVLRLDSLAAQLDPRDALSRPHKAWDFSAWLPNTPRPNASAQGERHVCAEVYLGNKYDWPLYQHGMEQEQCTDVPPFSSVLTAVLPAESWPDDVLELVLAQIRKLYEIPVVVLVRKGGSRAANESQVSFVEMDSGISNSENLNAAVSKVTTPFVLLGESLAHFSNQSSLERLVRVLDDLDHVQVAGGAARDTRGHWSHGCLQQHMANYQAKYTLGYYHSKYECMYCDDLLTPFVTRTKLLHSLAFSAGLSGQAVYRDWFAKVRGAGHLAVLCPDVMFFLGAHVNMTADDWLPVARRWSLERVQAFDGREHVFSCESVGISCKNPLGIIKSYLLPPCCIAEMEEVIGYLVSYAEQNHLDYELHLGSVLGAIKLGQYLPWDYDTDIVVNCHQFDEWWNIDAYMNITRIKCRKKMVWNGYMNIICPHFFLEIICHKGRNNSRVHLPAEYRDIPTQALYSGRWINVRSNPGLYCRNAMGLEVLRHAAHWRTLKTSAEAKARGGYDSPGTWNKSSDDEGNLRLSQEGDREDIDLSPTGPATFEDTVQSLSPIGVFSFSSSI